MMKCDAASRVRASLRQKEFIDNPDLPDVFLRLGEVVLCLEPEPHFRAGAKGL